MTASVRSSLLVLWEAPFTGVWQPGLCHWCGEPIELRDPSDHRRRRREIHYGDSHEAEGSPGCRREQNRARVWSARDALVNLAWRNHEGRMWCACCGEVVHDGEHWQPIAWEADHIVPLEDGGAHAVENFQVLCWPCHRDKTAAEATARAARRMAPVAEQLLLTDTQVAA